MKNLIKNTEIDANEFVNLLNNEEIIIYESIQGSKIWVNYVNDNLYIRPKSVNQKPLNLIDLAYQKYYKHALAYLISLPKEVTDLLRPSMYFCFEYFPDNQPANISYDRIPKNHLILTCIYKYNSYVFDVEELKVYADLFDVETLPLLYKGKLSEKQLKAINIFLHTNKQDLEIFFKETNFAEFFLKLLNPNLKNSYLKNNYHDNLEKLVIRFLKTNCESTLEILNPMYHKMLLHTDAEFSDVYSILIFNFMQWLIHINIEEIECTGTTRELVYINLICKLFNMYVQKNEKNIIDFDFTIPQFFNTDKFKINQDLITNKTTLDYLNIDIKLEYLFKIILSCFQKEKKKNIGILNDTVLLHLNKLIKKINIKVEEQFNYNRKLSKYNFKITDLTAFPNITLSEDNKGYVYPEVDKLFDTDDENNKKKITKK